MQKDIQIVKPTLQEFRQLIPQITDAFAKAMRDTPPWNIDIDKKTTRTRFRTESSQNDFGSILAQKANTIVGMSKYGLFEFGEFYESLFPEQVDQMRHVIDSLSQQTGINHILTISATFVIPSERRQHVATDMRTALLAAIQCAYPDGAIIITQHLDNNPGIITSSQKLGFTPTGIKFGPNQFWYKVLSPSQ